MATVELTKENFEKIIDDSAIIIIDFWAEWCGPCKSFSPIFEQVSTEFPNVVFAKVDIEQQQELAQDFQVRSIPQLVVMKEKVVVFSESGTLPISGLQDLVQQAISLDIDEVKKQLEKKE